MRLLIQLVNEADVQVDGAVVGRCRRGALAFLGVHKDDRPEQIPWMANKFLNLRVFPDEQGKMNRSLLDIRGEVLVVSQFTLYGNCAEGRRPSFSDAAPPEQAKALYEAFVDAVRQSGLPVETGVFGAAMQVRLVNDGPATFLIESRG